MSVIILCDIRISSYLCSKKYRSMKRFLFLSMLVFIAVMIWVSVHEKEEMPLMQKLERAMRLTLMKEYHDETYDYTIRYPSFFEQTDDSLMEKGNCRFSRHSWSRILGTCPSTKRWKNTHQNFMPLTSRKVTAGSFSQGIYMVMTDG